MKKILSMIIVTLLFISVTASFAANNNFQFQISHYQTKRQGGQTLDLYIRYAMKDGDTNYPDYRDLRATALHYLEPTKALPVDTFWEFIATALGDELMKKYSFAGISVQMLVYPNEQGEIFEPGFHGPIYTVGDVIPLAQVVLPVGSQQQLLH